MPSASKRGGRHMYQSRLGFVLLDRDSLNQACCSESGTSQYADGRTERLSAAYLGIGCRRFTHLVGCVIHHQVHATHTTTVSAERETIFGTETKRTRLTEVSCHVCVRPRGVCPNLRAFRTADRCSGSPNYYGTISVSKRALQRSTQDGYSMCYHVTSTVRGGTMRSGIRTCHSPCPSTDSCRSGTPRSRPPPGPSDSLASHTAR